MNMAPLNVVFRRRETTTLPCYTSRQQHKQMERQKMKEEEENQGDDNYHYSDTISTRGYVRLRYTVSYATLMVDNN